MTKTEKVCLPTTTSSKEASKLVPEVQRGHPSASVTVWRRVNLITSINFCEKGMKTSVKIYQNTILENVVNPFNHTLFKNKHRVFHQDSA